MGKDPDAIYREIVEHRSRMSAHIDRLQERARDDLQSLRDNASAHASNLSDQVPEPLAGAPDRVSEHPLSYMAGGFGAGVLLGILTPKVSTMAAPVTGMVRHNGHESQSGSQNGHSKNGNGSSGGLLSTITGAISGTAMSSVKDAVRPLVDDAMAGLRGDDRPPEVRDRTKST